MAGSGRERGATLDLWGHLRPPRWEAAGDEEESDEDFEEEPLLVEDALLEAAGRELSAALPPRRSGEGRAGRVRCPLCSGSGLRAAGSERGPALREWRRGRRCSARPGSPRGNGPCPAPPAVNGRGRPTGNRGGGEPVVQGKRGLCSSGAQHCNRKETQGFPIQVNFAQKKPHFSFFFLLDANDFQLSA